MSEERKVIGFQEVIKKYLDIREHKACLYTNTYYDPEAGVVKEYLGEDKDGRPVERAVCGNEVEEWLKTLTA